MALGYYLQDNPSPNPNAPAQYGWLRTPLGKPGPKVSGVVGVHTSEAITDFEGIDNNAENNAAFVNRRSDYGGYHTTADADSIVALVHPAWAVWADTTNNAHAMSVSGCLQAARWLEMTPARRRAVVVNMAHAAAAMVRTAVRDGYLAAPTPARRISAAEAISGSRPGFYGHGETNPGRRYDPGAHFDWDLFLATYASALGGGVTLQSSITTPEDDMFTDADKATLETTLGKVKTLVGMLDNVAGGVNSIPSAILDKQVPRAGQDGATTSLALFLSYADADREATLGRIQSAIQALPAAEVAAQIDAAGAAAAVRDELVKLLGGK